MSDLISLFIQGHLFMPRTRFWTKGACLSATERKADLKFDHTSFIVYCRWRFVLTIGIPKWIPINTFHILAEIFRVVICIISEHFYFWLVHFYPRCFGVFPWRFRNRTPLLPAIVFLIVCIPRWGEGVLPYMGYIGMCRCEGYCFQAVYSSVGYINQSVWV